MLLTPARLPASASCLGVALAETEVSPQADKDGQSIAQASILYSALDTRHWTEGNRTIQYAYDANGSLTSKISKESGVEFERTVYEYNLQNRLAKVSVSTDGGPAYERGLAPRLEGREACGKGGQA